MCICHAPPHARFVARFSVTSDSSAWRGSAGSGPGALLYCEYLPPAVMVKELQVRACTWVCGELVA